MEEELRGVEEGKREDNFIMMELRVMQLFLWEDLGRVISDMLISVEVGWV
jgi:hypothetical protein